MSTRSVLAVQTGDTWKGRYCHGDGYPSWQLRQLHRLVQRDGLDAVRTMLTETHAGWSFIDPDRVDLSEVKPDPNAEYGTAERYAADWERTYRDGRFCNVPGYGIAYTTTVLPGFAGESNYQQVEEDDWITAEEPDTDTAWAYVLTDRSIVTYGRCGDGWEAVGRTAYDDELSDAAISAIECGERFERCSHYAWTHFPEAEGTRVSTGIWLGLEQPRLHDIDRVIDRSGQTLTLSGSGELGTANTPSYRAEGQVRYWWVSVRDHPDLRLARSLKNGYRLEVDAIVATSAGDKIVPAGTVVS